MQKNLINAMERAIAEVRQWPEKTVQVFHHNDAMGSHLALSSRAHLKERDLKSGGLAWKSHIPQC